METVKVYDAHLDSKKRITLRGAAFENYNVKIYKNGCIILEPRVLAVQTSTPERYLPPSTFLTFERRGGNEL